MSIIEKFKLSKLCQIENRYLDIFSLHTMLDVVISSNMMWMYLG